MNIKKGNTLELDITQLAFGGKGIARVGGMAVFVDQTIPQDRVLARIIKKKKKYAEARVVEMLDPSPMRVQAPCSYSGICGGCKWQSLDYGRQLAFKQQQVQESLAHIGHLQDVVVHPTIGSERIYGYRNKMEFSCAERRWLLPEELGRDDVDTGMALGLHVPGTYYKVLDIDACLLQQDLGNQLLADVREFIKQSPMPVYGLKTHQGFWRFLVLRHSVAYDQWMVNIVTAAKDLEQVQPLGERIVQAYPQVVSVVNNITSSKAGVAIGEYEINLAGESRLLDRIGNYEFELSANSFFQTNTLAARRLYDAVLDFARLSGTEHIIDVYCGAGTIAIYLSGRAKSVTGLEMVPSAIEDGRRNCRRNGVQNCEFIGGDVRSTLAQIDDVPEVMVIDPPRSGMHPDVVNQVLRLRPGRIVYVSCNPATMARDIGLLKDMYRLVEVQPVDMFPHTYHIEAVGRLEMIH